MLTFESVEIYLFVLWKFQAIVGIQGVCRYTANFCFSLLVSWNRSLKCGYNYLQLIVTPQKHFQTNDVATTSSRVWQHWGKYLAAIKCHYFGFGELLYFNRTWRTKQETPSETNWMRWSLQSFSLQIVRRTCFQTSFRSTFNRRLNSQQGVWSRLHVECSIGDHLWDDPWVWSPSRHKGSFNIHFQQRKRAIKYTSKVRRLVFSGLRGNTKTGPLGGPVNDTRITASRQHGRHRWERNFGMNESSVAINDRS